MVHRGADSASDYHLVVAKTKMKLNRGWLHWSKRPCYNVCFLKVREISDRFTLSLNNMHQVLQDFLENESVDLQTQEQLTKETWINACVKILGKKKLPQRSGFPRRYIARNSEP